MDSRLWCLNTHMEVRNNEKDNVDCKCVIGGRV